eukprot:scaffold168692_cov40-Cyclotella_meneghiniana.AAC.1
MRAAAWLLVDCCISSHLPSTYARGSGGGEFYGSQLIAARSYTLTNHGVWCRVLMVDGDEIKSKGYSRGAC